MPIGSGDFEPSTKTKSIDSRAPKPQPSEPITEKEQAKEITETPYDQKEAQYLKQIDELKRQIDKEKHEKTLSRLDSYSESELDLLKKLEETSKQVEEAKRKLEEKDTSLAAERFLSRNSDKYAFINAEGAQDIVIREMKKYEEKFNKKISLEEAANRVEVMLKDINRDRINKLKNNKEFSEMLGEVSPKDTKSHETQTHIGTKPYSSPKSMSHRQMIESIIEKSKKRQL